LWWPAGPSPHAVSNAALSVGLVGLVRPDALALALGDVIARHENLRMQIVGDSGEAVIIPARVTAAAPLPLEERSVSPASSATLHESVRRPFDLTSELPLRAHLLRTSPLAYTLHLVLHPIAFDAWSVRAFVTDLAHAYAARAGGRSPRWPGPAPQHSEYVAWRHGSEDDDADLDVETAPYARSSKHASRIEALAVRLNPGLHQRLVREAGRSRASLLMLMHAALAMTLPTFGIAGDCVVATMVARTDPRWRGMVGPVATRLLLRAETANAAPVGEVLARTRAIHLEAYASLARAGTQLSPDAPGAPRHDAAPPVTVMLHVQRRPRQEVTVRLPDVTISAASFSPSMEGCELALDFVERRGVDERCGGIEGTIRYRAELLPGNRSQSLMDALYGTLSHLASGADDPAAGRSQTRAESSGERADPSAEAPLFLTGQSAGSGALYQVARPRFAWSSVYLGYHPTHDQLIHLWERMLGVRHVGIFDDFADLGGTESMCEEMLRVVAAIFQQRVAAAPGGRVTIAALADELVRRVSPTQPFEAPGDGTTPPLWFLHGDYKGGGLYCRELCHYLPPAQRFIALPPRSDHGGFAETIEAMADEKLACLLQVQPDGPFHIAGYCVSGYVAYEIARRLTTMRRQVAALVLIDCHYRAPANTPAAGTDDFGRGGYDWFNYLSAARRYRPERWHGKVHLLSPAEQPFNGYDPVGDWRSLADEVAVRRIRGGHTTCITRYPESVASALDECMAGART
jgi:hypothetical protein